MSVGLGCRQSSARSARVRAMWIRRRRSTVGAGLPAMDEYQPAHLPTVTPPSRASPLPQGFVVLVEAGLLGVERRQTGGVGGRVLFAFGHGDRLDGTPLIVPTLCVVMHPVTLCVTVAQGVKPGRGASGAAFPRRAWERAGSGVTWGRAAANWWYQWSGLVRVRQRGLP